MKYALIAIVSILVGAVIGGKLAVEPAIWDQAAYIYAKDLGSSAAAIVALGLGLAAIFQSRIERYIFRKRVEGALKTELASVARIAISALKDLHSGESVAEIVSQMPTRTRPAGQALTSRLYDAPTRIIAAAAIFEGRIDRSLDQVERLLPKGERKRNELMDALLFVVLSSAQYYRSVVHGFSTDQNIQDILTKQMHQKLSPEIEKLLNP